MTTPRTLETIKSMLDAEERAIRRLMDAYGFSRVEAMAFIDMFGDADLELAA